MIREGAQDVDGLAWKSQHFFVTSFVPNYWEFSFFLSETNLILIKFVEKYTNMYNIELVTLSWDRRKLGVTHMPCASAKQPSIKRKLTN